MDEVVERSSGFIHGLPTYVIRLAIVLNRSAS